MIDFFGGAGAALWDTGGALVGAAHQAVVDPLGIQRGTDFINTVAANGIDGTAAMMWEGITEPYTSRWNTGDQAGAIGYGTAEAILAIVGTKGTTKLTSTASKASQIAQRAAAKTESRILTSVDDLPCNCFVGGTLVQTTTGAKPIEDVRIGDHVWAKNVETGRIEPRPVTGLFQKQAAALMVVTLASGVTAVVTTEHPFMVDGEGWVLSGDLRAGDRLTQRSGGFAVIDRIDLRWGEQTVYNFEVADNHNYYVTDAQLLVHNCPVPSPGFGRGTASPEVRDSRRLFTRTEISERLAQVGGTCEQCDQTLQLPDAKGHHLIRHADGGLTVPENLAVLCETCHIDIHRP